MAIHRVGREVDMTCSLLYKVQEGLNNTVNLSDMELYKLDKVWV